MAAPPPSREFPIDCEELYTDAYVRVELCAKGTLVRIVRTALAHPNTAALRASFEGVIKALDRSGRRARQLLFDSRAPIGRNDPAFELEMAALRPLIDRGFARIAVLVQSASGVLQIRRWFSEDGVERAVGPDEAALLAFLRGETTRRPGSGNSKY